MSFAFSLGGRGRVKRAKKSGAENKRSQKKQKKENEELSISMQKYFVRQGGTDNNSCQKQMAHTAVHVDSQEGQQIYPNTVDYHKQIPAAAVGVDNQLPSVSVEPEQEECISVSYDRNSDHVSDYMEDVNFGGTSQVRKNVTGEKESNESEDNIEEDVRKDYPINVTAGQHDLEHELPIESPQKVDLNPRIVIDKNMFDPSSLVGLQLSRDEKSFLLEMEPCQPSDNVLRARQKKQGDRNRHCSQDIFHHKSGMRRKWVSYSMSMDSVFCIPCLLFTDFQSRGEQFRANQGNAFVVNGFSNWKKQTERIHKHEECDAHRNAKIAQVIFQQGLNIEALIDDQTRENEKKRISDVKNNRDLLERIIDAIFLLGRQGLALRGHDEKLSAAVNNGNFLELLKLLGKYDSKVGEHLRKVEKEHKKLKAQKVKGKKRGRGSKITFLSHNSQEKLIKIIGNQITRVIARKIKKCLAWSLIVDTTPDITHKEELSICVRIVSRAGYVTEHILGCKRAYGTTANELFEIIIKAFESKNISFKNVVAQTYDGASNMSGCYNGLQAIIKQKIGKHVLYVHCYAHSLNLVLTDTVGVDPNVITLFDNLEALHNLFNRSIKIHNNFENAQKDAGVRVFSVKRLNTVRWSSRELCLNVFHQRYDILMRVLQNVIEDTTLNNKQRAVATGLRQSFLKKDIIATAYLFKEIFSITGPLNRYLQSTKMDLGKANGLVNGVNVQLGTLRETPDLVINQLNTLTEDSQWDVDGRRKRTGTDEDQDGETLWRRSTFYPVLDQIIASLNRRFSQNASIFGALSMFSPIRFTSIIKQYQNSEHLADSISTFCNCYDIDQTECAKELFSFAGIFKTLMKTSRNLEEEDSEEESEESEGDEDNYESGEDKTDDDQSFSFYDALQVITNPTYHLVDAYPILCKVYAIAVAIPVTSCTAERTFSVLKRVKTRLRSSMLQDRLESLLLVAIEKRIVNCIDKDDIIDDFAKSSPELSKLLIE